MADENESETEVQEEENAPDTEVSEDSAPEQDAPETDAPDPIADLTASVVALTGKVDTVLDSLATFREQVAAMKIEAGAVVRDDPDSGDIVEVADIPDPYKRDYTI